MSEYKLRIIGIVYMAIIPRLWCYVLMNSTNMALVKGKK